MRRAGENASAPDLALGKVLDLMREGFAVCEMIRDDQGRVSDYRILQANSAYLKGLGGKAAVGRRLRELRPEVSDNWYAHWHDLLKSGKRTRFEYFDPGVRRWYDCRVTPIEGDRVIQLYIDVTWRKQAEADQAALFNELNHRVKNNLMTVSSFLAMQARATRDTDVRHHLNQAISRIRTVSDVHAILYRTGAVDTVDLSLYVAELCKRLEAVSGGRLTIKPTTAPLAIGSEGAMRLGIILNELITNAAKHAYPEGVEGLIAVSVTPQGEALSVIVRDFGKGFEGDTPPNPGLGVRLIRSMTQNKGGAFSIESDSGVTVRVLLPLQGRPISARPV